MQELTHIHELTHRQELTHTWAMALEQEGG